MATTAQAPAGPVCSEHCMLSSGTAGFHPLLRLAIVSFVLAARASAPPPEGEGQLQPPPPAGHLRALFDLIGTRLGEVDAVDAGRYPQPAQFAGEYAPSAAATTAKLPQCNDVQHAGTPLLLRGLAESMPAFSKWATDAAIIRKAGHTLHAVEIGGWQETRKSKMVEISLAEFVRRQALERETLAGTSTAASEAGDSSSSSSSVDPLHYLVSPTPRELVRDLYLPPMLRCGGATEGENGMKSLLWMSTGGTSSVLHADPYDNIQVRRIPTSQPCTTEILIQFLCALA
jgi:hypothetical protein